VITDITLLHMLIAQPTILILSCLPENVEMTKRNMFQNLSNCCMQLCWSIVE